MSDGQFDPWGPGYPQDYDDSVLDELTASEKFPTDGEVDQRTELARRKATQTHEFRETLFRTVRRALVTILAMSSVVMVLYMISEWGDVSPAVMISYNVAVVVNTIGLAYIIANYLFPRGGAD